MSRASQRRGCVTSRSRAGSPSPVALFLECLAVPAVFLPALAGFGVALQVPAEPVTPAKDLLGCADFGLGLLLDAERSADLVDDVLAAR